MKIKYLIQCWKLAILKLISLLISTITLIIISVLSIFINEKKIDVSTDTWYKTLRYDEIVDGWM